MILKVFQFNFPYKFYQPEPYMFKKILLAFTLTALIFLSLPLFALAKEPAKNLKINQKSTTNFSKTLQNLDRLDPQKPKSQKLTKDKNNPNELISDQNNLQIKFNLKDKKVKLQNKDKGDITIGIPNPDNFDSVDEVDNKLIYSGINSKTDIIVDGVDGGVRQIINIKDSSAPSFYDFNVELSPGDKLELTSENGSVVKDKDNKTKVVVAKPWARDANGKELMTWYTIQNSNTLRQNIDLKNAVFPVVADPAWCGNQINKVQWAWRNIYSNRHNWSLEVSPTWCGRFLATDTWGAWTEVYDLTPRCSRYSGNTCVTIPWNKQWNTSQYWSMYNQFVCHYANPLAQITKSEWNLEPWRPNVGLSGMYRARCNPT